MFSSAIINIMANASVQLKGQDKVLAHLKKLSNPNQLLDTAIKQTAANSIARLVKGTLSNNPQIKGMNTGTTARNWTNPKKIAPGTYQVTNEYKSGKWNIARLINDGHGEIRPKKKFLYIPLNKSAAQKRLGANIPDNLKRGTDYVFAKKVKAKTGSKFIDKEIPEASRELTKRVIAQIRKVFT